LAQGWNLAVRAAGSKGVWDIIAYSPGCTLFVQVKLAKDGKFEESFEEFCAMKNFAVGDQDRKELWVWTPGKIDPEIRRIL
jgi:Holliday junction resolvase